MLIHSIHPHASLCFPYHSSRTNLNPHMRVTFVCGRRRWRVLSGRWRVKYADNLTSSKDKMRPDD